MKFHKNKIPTLKMTEYVIILSTKEHCGACFHFKHTGVQDRFMKAVARFGERVKFFNDDYTGMKKDWKISHPNFEVQGVPDISFIPYNEFSDPESKLEGRKNIPLHRIVGKSVDEIYDILKSLMNIEKPKLRFRRLKEVRKGENKEINAETFSSLKSDTSNKKYGFPEGATNVKIKKTTHHLQRI